MPLPAMTTVMMRQLRPIFRACLRCLVASMPVVMDRKLGRLTNGFMMANKPLNAVRKRLIVMAHSVQVVQFGDILSRTPVVLFADYSCAGESKWHDA